MINSTTGNTRGSVDGGCREDLASFVEDTIIQICAPEHRASLEASRGAEANGEPAMKIYLTIFLAVLFSSPY